MSKGDHEMAIRYYRVSLNLSPDSSNAARMIARILGEQQVNFVSADKS